MRSWRAAGVEAVGPWKVATTQGSELSCSIVLVPYSSGWSSAAMTTQAAFEKRVALVVALGANHDWGAVQRARARREGERPVPHYWEHALWVWGHQYLDEFLDCADRVNLDGIVEQITVPFLIAHGEGDRQILVAYAHKSHEQAVNSHGASCACSTPRRAVWSTSASTTSRTSRRSSPTGLRTRSAVRLLRSDRPGSHPPRPVHVRGPTTVQVLAAPLIEVPCGHAECAHPPGCSQAHR